MAFGNAILVRGRIDAAWNVPLGGREPRALLVADVEVDEGPLLFGATHLAPQPDERALQIRELSSSLAQMWSGAEHEIPFVLAGDLNAQPHALAPLSEFLELAPPQLTYPAIDPSTAIDHVFFSRQWRCVAAFAAPSHVSDHAALVVDLEPLPRASYPGDSSVY